MIVKDRIPGLLNDPIREIWLTPARNSTDILVRYFIISLYSMILLIFHIIPQGLYPYFIRYHISLNAEAKVHFAYSMYGL